jgi:cytochrome oxidase Cu insertion factor (SCO1/SenC/PrrC family)
MIPHEREMVKKYEGKPFEFVSISFDDSKETLQKFMKKEPMPWTHWFNGPDGAFGKDWNIKHFPTIYVIDAKGVIRYKEIRGKKLDEAVETLVAEAEKK